MRTRFLTLLAATSLATSPAQAAEKPDLVVAISVDQFSANLFDEYRPLFRGGLKRLAEGTAFANGYQAHSATETCPGHSTILTGAYPARSGIVANDWGNLFVARDNKEIYCAEDEDRQPLEGQSYVVSSVHLKVPTLGDVMKAADPRSRNVAVSGKDRAGVMMGGHHVDQRWYWSRNGFVTDQEGVEPPRSVALASQAALALIARPQPPLELPEYCAAKSRMVALEGGGDPVGNGQLSRDANDFSKFQQSPAYDAAVLALAASLVNEMGLGQGEATDLLSVGLSATDYVGHRYGPGGAEMCLQLHAIDRELGDFFQFLDSKGIDYQVVLTADHGGLDIPERLRLLGVEGAARLDPSVLFDEVNRTVSEKLELQVPPMVVAGELYLNPALTDEQRGPALAGLIEAFEASPLIEAAFPADAVAATPIPHGDPTKWSLIERFRATYYPGRSGDLLIAVKPNVTPIGVTTNYVSTHGSPWDYDRRVPILFWRKGQAANDRSEAIKTVDIMPTLAAELGLSIDPDSIDGSCLAVVAGNACPGN